MGPTEVGLGSVGTSSMLELWLPEPGSFLGPTPVPPGGADEGSPTEMGWKAWELFPARLWALHSYVLLCSKVPTGSWLWTVTLWKGSWLRTLVCGFSKTCSTWASSHLGRAECGSGFQVAHPSFQVRRQEESTYLSVWPLHSSHVTLGWGYPEASQITAPEPLTGLHATLTSGGSEEERRRERGRVSSVAPSPVA